MRAYLDTSVLLRKLLGEPGAFKEWGRLEKCYTSEITSVEALRALDRLRLEGKLRDIEVSEKMRLLREMLEAVGRIALNGAVLEKASQSYPTVVGALDAIHLASASLYVERQKEKLLFLTHDCQLAVAAQALGFEVSGARLI